MNFHGFVGYENIDIQVVGDEVVCHGTGKFDVIHGSPDNGLSVLFGLTKAEADMAVTFLNEQEGKANWQNIQNRLMWCDRNHSGLDALVKPSLVHGGVTTTKDPLVLSIQNGQIVFESEGQNNV